ncbi:hypothetical protein DVK07_21365, partial [Halorubrum sp. Atlit-26R]
MTDPDDADGATDSVSEPDADGNAAEPSEGEPADEDDVESEAGDDAVVLSPETWQRAVPPRTPPIAADPPP